MFCFQMAAALALALVSSVSAHSMSLAAMGQARQQTLEREWQRELEPETKVVPYKSPVKRVVLLLEKMKDELTHEADTESEMYDRMVCWCETNQKEKTQAVKDAEARALDLSAEVESRSARFGKLATEIKNLKKQIAEDTAALEKAQALREKGAAGFRGEEKELVQIIDNLRNAIAVLEKHHRGTLLQLNAPLVSGLRVLLRNAALRRETMLSDSNSVTSAATGASLLSVGEAGTSSRATGLDAALMSALDVHGGEVAADLPLRYAAQVVAGSAAAVPTARPGGAFLQSGERAPIDAAYKSYSSRSSQIFGVLTQMLEEFEAQLKASQKDEVTSLEDFKAMAEAKSEQIAVGKEKLDEFEGEHADNTKALSDANENLDLRRQQRSVDVKFLQSLKLQCNDLDKEWERRSATRAEELKAVTEAIAILTTDDNREMLAKSVTLLQEHAATAASTTAAARRKRAAEALRRAAQAPDFEADDLLAAWRGRSGTAAVGAAAGPRAQLSTLAMTVQLDSFTKVKEMMDKMLKELQNQQQEEADFKAYCNKELNQNEKATYTKQQEKKDLIQKIDSLSDQEARLMKEIKEAQAQIAATETEIKKASEAREGENSEFQRTVADQRATQEILKKALLRLKDFYMKGIGKKVIYMQRSEQAQTPPEKFLKYKANDGSNPVMGLLEQIIEDSKALEKEATTAEYKAQADYEVFVKDSNGLAAELSRAISLKTKEKAAAKLEKAETKSDLDSTNGELDSLAAYETDLHNQCDFVVKNFEIRQKARRQEMEAIQAAKAILSGAGSE